MALRDQPYLPLYVQDFLTDEKLAECSASANGVYIRIMCLMHKSEEYGKISLKEKDICRGKSIGKTSGKYDGKVEIFAGKLARHLPYDFDEIESGLTELLDEGVLSIEDNTLCQKRMIRDAEISEKRAVSGRRGAIASNNRDNNPDPNPDNFAGQFAGAKEAANSENEYENKNDIDIDKEKGFAKGKGKDVEVEVIEDVEFDAFKTWISTNAPKVAKMDEPFTRDQYYAILKDYRIEDVKHTLEAMHNYKKLATRSAYLTCRNWLRRDNVPTLSGSPETPAGPTSGKVGSALGAIAGALRK